MERRGRKPQAWNDIGPWTRGKRLGIGGFGSVYIGVRNSDRKCFAVKSVYFVPRSTSKPANSRQAQREILEEQMSLCTLINEIRTLKKLRSPYIVRYIGCGTARGPKEMDHRLLLDCYLEYLPRGSLWNIVSQSPGKRLKEPFIKAYTKDILRGLVYLHFNNLVHGDIKCQNILMGPDNCKVADFGSIKDVRTSFVSKILFGTESYKAPEVEAGSEQTYASDIFSLGCTVVEMATGTSPKRGEKHKQLDSNKYANRVIPDHLSPECKDFLSKCFAPNPRRRWTASNLLNHPFIAQPLNPRYHPYHMPLDAKTEKNLLKFEPDKLIIPPSDLDSTLPGFPFSPIHVVPMKRRRTSMGCLNVDETDVAMPQFVPEHCHGPQPGARALIDQHSEKRAATNKPPRPEGKGGKKRNPKRDQQPPEQPQQYYTAHTGSTWEYLYVPFEAGPDKPTRDRDSFANAGSTWESSSDLTMHDPPPKAPYKPDSPWEDPLDSTPYPYPPPYKPEHYPRDPDGNYSTPTAEERETRVEQGRAALAADPIIQIQRSEVASSFYKGHRVDFPPVAQLKGDDEDQSPLVVTICSEFGMPLPPEYQKWILDPDFNPEAVANPPEPQPPGPFKKVLWAIGRFIMS